MIERMGGQVRAKTTTLALALLMGTPAVAAGEGSAADNPALLGADPHPCMVCAPHPTAEPTDPWLDIDWSVGLRGRVTIDDAGERTELTLSPEATLTHQFLRGAYEVTGSAEIALTPDGDARITSLGLTGEGSYALDELTTATGTLTLGVSQDDPNGPDQPTNLNATPIVLDASLEGGITREVGLADIGLRGRLEREMTGETSYDDGSTDDNSYRDNTIAAIGGRLGWRVTPWFAAWLDGEVAVQAYDQVSPSLGVALDNTTYTGKAGVTVAMRDTTRLETSVGMSWRDFSDETLGDVSALLFAASLSHQPAETLTLDAELQTTLSGPEADTSGTASVVYALSGTANMQISPWLRARTSAGASLTRPLGAGDEEMSWNAGAGLDWLFDRHTDFNADYTFAQSKTGSDPAEDTHTVSLGVTWHR